MIYVPSPGTRRRILVWKILKNVRTVKIWINSNKQNGTTKSNKINDENFIWKANQILHKLVCVSIAPLGIHKKNVRRISRTYLFIQCIRISVISSCIAYVVLYCHEEWTTLSVLHLKFISEERENSLKFCINTTNCIRFRSMWPEQTHLIRQIASLASHWAA